MPAGLQGAIAQLGWGVTAAVLLAGAAGLSVRLDAFHRAEGAARYPVPRAGVVRAVATGYEDVLADAFWLQFLQYDGAKLSENPATRRWQHVWAGLRLITGLDPHFKDAYLFGSWVLSDAGHPRQAEALLERAIARDRRWPAFAERPRYDFQLGFVRFLYLHDYASARHAFKRAADLASHPPYRDPYLEEAGLRMTAGMAERQDHRRLAGTIWKVLYRHAVAAHDRRMQAIAARALARLRGRRS